MKRLWIRLSAVAAVVASLGGGGYYFFQGGTAADGDTGTALANNDVPPQAPPVMPLADNGDVSFKPDARQQELADDGAYGGVAPEPAQATWQDQPSQPIIRQVSGSESDMAYGSAPDYRAGDAPPADPSSAYGADEVAAGDAPYDPTDSYGAADSDAATAAGGARLEANASSPAYGASGGVSDSGYVGNSYGSSENDPSSSPQSGAGTPAYGQSTQGTSSDDGPNYGAPNYGASDYGTAGSEPSSYAAPGTPPAAPPAAASRQDFDQPVSAPSFATGDPVSPASRVAVDAGVAAMPTAPPAAPQFDQASSPQFDPTPGSTGARQPPAAATAYEAPATSATPVSYGQTQAVAAAGGALVAGTPGDRTLDGRQTPSISLEKMAPAEIQVGKPAAFKTMVRNTGEVVAKNVVVTDRLPQGTQLVDVTPQPTQAPDGSLVWRFESLEPGEEVLISLEVMPQVEGEIGSQAVVTFQAQASVRTICTKPQLLVEHSTNPKVLIGEDVVFDITISNPGSGDATGIVLEEDVPPGLSHVAGNELEYEVGTLRPGETRRLELVLKASAAGLTSNKLRVRGDANLLAEHAVQLEVIAPKLQVGMLGPQRRYLDRQVKYQVAFGNTGTAIAKNIELATYLPKGLQFVSTSGKGQYDTRDHAVFWSLDQLAPGQEGAVELVAVPIATGEQKLQIEGTADLGLSDKSEHVTVVEAITELVFTVSDTQDPIEVGSETTYEIRVVNNGSKTATNVQLAALLPAELTPDSGEGTTRVAIQGQQVVMEPIERLEPRKEAIYKLRVKGQRAGDHVIDVRLVCDEVPTPVTKQESTKVYADRF